MDTSITYYVANAFAPQAFGGNPAAVFPQANDLSDAQMQAIAKQLNLVETVFVLPPSKEGADFELRYFTPDKELPLAGHPTIAAWFVLAREGYLDRQGVFIQQTQKGFQQIRVETADGATRIIMQQEPPVFHGVCADRSRVAAVFSLNPDDLLPDFPVESVDTGLGHIVFGVKDLATLMRVRRNIEALKNLCLDMKASEAQIFCQETYDPLLTLHTRNICPREGMEDPACGVGNSALLAYLMRHGFLGSDMAEMLAEQGHIEQRPSVIYVKGCKKAEFYELELGGSAILMTKGTFFL